MLLDFQSEPYIQTRFKIDSLTTNMTMLEFLVREKFLTFFHEKCLSAAKAMVIEGLRWAPEMWPVDKITIITASPVEAARPRRLSVPCVFWFTIAVAVPAKISMKVPRNSAPTWFLHQPIKNETSNRIWVPARHDITQHRSKERFELWQWVCGVNGLHH